MPRLHRFTLSLFSGYAAVLVSAVLTLLTIPVALHYLGNEQFGLWALLQSLLGYIGIIDLGLAGAVCRLLVDHKDQPNGGQYGGLILTDLLVSTLQGLVILAAGLLLAQPLAHWMGIPAALAPSFAVLLRWGSLVMAGTFITRVANHILYAHQRMAVTNLIQVIAMAANTIVLWIGLALGWGLYSLLASQVATWAVTSIGSIMACIRLDFLPRARHWGKPSWEQFKTTFDYSKNVFLQVIGTQLTTATQTVIISHQPGLGLEAAAIWAVTTKAANMLVMLIGRIMGYSAPAFAEMIARQERTLLEKRLRELSRLMICLGVVAAVGVATVNASFVQLWTGGKISWPLVNDVLLGLWVFAQVVSWVYTGFVPLTKHFALLGWVTIIEGLAFVCAASLLAGHGGMTTILTVSFLTVMGVTTPYSLHLTARYLGHPMRSLIHEWLSPVLKMTILLGTAAGLAVWLGHSLGTLVEFSLTTAVCCVGGGLLLLRTGLSASMLKFLTARLPQQWQSLLARLQSFPHRPN